MYNADPPSNIHLNAWQQWFYRIEQRMQDQEDTIKQLQTELEQLKQRLEKEQLASLPTIHVDKIEYRFDQLKVETLEGSLQIGLSTSNPEQLPLMIEDIMMQQANQSGNNHSNGKQGTANPSAANKPYSHPIGSSNNMHYSDISNSKLDYMQEKFTSLRSEKGKAINEQSVPLEKNINHQNDSEKQYVRQQQQENKQQTKQEQLLTLRLQQLTETCLQQLQKDLYDKYKHYIFRQCTLLQANINEEHMTLIVEDIERQLPSRVHYYVHEQHARGMNDLKILTEQVMRLTNDDIESAIDQYIYQLSNQPKEGHD